MSVAKKGLQRKERVKTGVQARSGCRVRAGKRKGLMITWKKQKQGQRVLKKRWTEKKKRRNLP